MSHSRARLLVGTVYLTLVACGEAAPTDVGDFDEGAFDLPILAPSLTREDLTLTSIRAPRDSSAAPLLVTEIEDDAVASILSARTKVGYFYDEAFAEGSQTYTGTSGSVETTAEVLFENMHLGSQTAHAAASEVLSFKLTKFLFAYAPVRTDKRCGLSVSGRSQHSAWWELFQGTSAPAFGRAVTSTYGGPAEQPSCGHRIQVGDGGGRIDTERGITCTYLLTYDRTTGEVLRAERLFCSTTGGDLF
jgi:hypothetical protein